MHAPTVGSLFASLLSSTVYPWDFRGTSARGSPHEAGRRFSAASPERGDTCGAVEVRVAVLLLQQPQGRPVPGAVGVPAQRAQLVAVQQHEAEARRRAEVVRVAIAGRRGGRAGARRRAAAEAALRQAGPGEVVQLVVAPGVVHRHPQPSQRRQHPRQRRLRLGGAAPRVDAVDAVAQLQHEGGRRPLGGPSLHGGPQQAEAVPVVPPAAAPEIAAVLRVRVLHVRDDPKGEARGVLHGGRRPGPEGAGYGAGRGGGAGGRNGGVARPALLAAVAAVVPPARRCCRVPEPDAGAAGPGRGVASVTRGRAGTGLPLRVPIASRKRPPRSTAAHGENLVGGNRRGVLAPVPLPPPRGRNPAWRCAGSARPLTELSPCSWCPGERWEPPSSCAEGCCWP